jgi:hypothetical protein
MPGEVWEGVIIPLAFRLLTLEHTYNYRRRGIAPYLIASRRTERRMCDESASGDLALIGTSRKGKEISVLKDVDPRGAGRAESL